MFVEKHGLSKTKIYKVWKTIRVKSQGSNVDNRYKGENLEICVEWKDDPVAFVNWANENGYKENLQLVRKDKDKGFYPENCEFLQRKEATKTHGMRHTRIYSIWTQMIQRCTNQKLDHYKNYGGRGISYVKNGEILKSLKNGQ